MRKEFSFETINWSQALKKAVIKAGFVGAAVSSLFFSFGVPYLPEGWTPLIEKMSMVLTQLGWAVGGFILGGAIMALVASVLWTVRTAGGNWTRVGR
jgi:hypothetical protein